MEQPPKQNPTQKTRMYSAVMFDETIEAIITGNKRILVPRIMSFFPYKSPSREKMTKAQMDPPKKRDPIMAIWPEVLQVKSYYSTQLCREMELSQSIL